MNNDVAILLDLDNLVIGAAEANLAFDVQLILKSVKELTSGRIVLRRAYGDWRQRQNMPKELASAGFELQATVRLSNVSKNLADMQMVVDAMETLIDGHNFSTYVLATGDRDFMPLVQALRKRGKQVIGIGIKHTSSQSLASLCDHYIFYEDLIQTSAVVEEEEAKILLEQALDQLLKDTSRVPASLVKQRMHALSHGVFNHSKVGKRNFRHFLAQYPELVTVLQEESTIYAMRPSARPLVPPPVVKTAESNYPLSAAEREDLLRRALDKLLTEQPRVRASMLKQAMQELSDGVFDEVALGNRNFRQFLERYPELVKVEQVDTTLYVTRPAEAETVGALSSPNGQPLPEERIEELLKRALDDLLHGEQVRVRASLLKQRLQELTNGAFDESHQGDPSFRHFLERYSDLVGIQQTGSTLFVTHPQAQEEEDALHMRYRTALKKRGLRVVPPTARLAVLRDLVKTLRARPDIGWKELIDALLLHYQQQNNADISKSHINDVMRVARRAHVIEVLESESLASAPVKLHLEGVRSFQDAVMLCDACYLGEIQSLADPFDLNEAAVALYDTDSYARYLKVILNRYGTNGHPATA
jgi:uncharacterized protein (TIGR00288 family)